MFVANFLLGLFPDQYAPLIYTVRHGISSTVMEDQLKYFSSLTFIYSSVVRLYLKFFHWLACDRFIENSYRNVQRDGYRPRKEKEKKKKQSETDTTNRIYIHASVRVPFSPRPSRIAIA